MRVQVSRQRKEILALQRCGIDTASAERLLRRMVLTADGQQHINSKSALFQLRSCSDLQFYRPFRFDFTRELVFRTTLTW